MVKLDNDILNRLFDKIDHLDNKIDKIAISQGKMWHNTLFQYVLIACVFIFLCYIEFKHEGLRNSRDGVVIHNNSSTSSGSTSLHKETVNNTENNNSLIGRK